MNQWTLTVDMALTIALCNCPVIVRSATTVPEKDNEYAQGYSLEV